jgi:hypothetical protein
MAEQQTGYGERDQEPTTEQTGGDPADLREGEQGGGGQGGGDPASGAAGADSGGRAHTSPSEGHPAGEGPRSDREVGGPTAEDQAS